MRLDSVIMIDMYATVTEIHFIVELQGTMKLKFGLEEYLINKYKREVT